MQEALKELKKDPPLEAISPRDKEAALRVVQSLFLRASWMLLIAADKITCDGAPPA